MNQRPLIIATLSAALGFVALFFYKQSYEEKVCGGERVQVVVATQDLELGTALDSTMLGLVELPSRYVEGRHVRATDATKLLGVRLSSGIRANETILWSDLAMASDQRRDLSSLVNNGKRAVAVRTDSTSSFGGLLRPGDRVDVLLTHPSETQRLSTTVLLQNKLVLAAGSDTGGGQFTAVGDSVQSTRDVEQVVLSVSVDEAQLLAFGQERGTLKLVLRNPNDIAVLRGLPDATEEELRSLPTQRGAN
ncbi:MAG: Flp pilus assembly protein CpaB [Myxococcales bacterium]|nr:MAG: Flp pilus assembly protein CpaB [Myxococcales bacterium]